MAEWDLIECDFSAADETINFGTRAIGDCKNLYETSTLASIKNSADIVCWKKQEKLEEFERVIVSDYQC